MADRQADDWIDLIDAAESSAGPFLRDPLVRDMAAVLRSMGGSAHQNVVIDCVAALLRQRGEAVARSDLAVRILELLEACRGVFVRPFGEGSQRWALAPGLPA